MRNYFLIAFCLAALAACEKQTEAPKSPAPQVEGARITFASGDPGLAFIKTEAVTSDQGGVTRLPGRVVWDETRTVRILPPLAGKVTRMLAKPGDAMHAGQALAMLSSPDFGQVRAEWRKAEADTALAAKNLARSRELHEAGVLPLKELQQAEADHARAVAETARATSRYRQFASRAGDEGQEYALNSPIDGVVVERNVNPGQEIRPDAPPLFVVSDPTRLWLTLDGREDELAALAPGKEIRVEARAWPGETFAARITHVADFIDPVSRTVKVRAELADPTRRLKAEMFVTAVIASASSGHPLAPAKAVFLEAGGEHAAFVEIVPGQFERRRVKIGRARGEQMEIVEGVRVGDKVVSEGNLHLVRLLGASTPAKPGKETAGQAGAAK